MKGLNVNVTAKELAENDVKEVANLVFANCKDNKVIDYVQAIRGDEIKKYLVYVTEKLQIAEKQTSALMIGLNIGAAGLLSIGS